MTTFQPTYPQTQQQQPLPTMYDLPSDNPEDPGLPDEFHDWQPQLLSETFVPATYPPEQVFTAKDLNLYYDSQNPRLYKRPDWFGVVGVPRLLEPGKGRLSYLIWQEGRAPMAVVELLSPNTQEADQGLTPRGLNIPSKWEVYETILRVPYYVVFNRIGDRLRLFQLQGGSYQELFVDPQESSVTPKLWIEELQIGLGLWQGSFAGVERQWLRWYDREGNWIENTAEREQRAERRAERAEQLAEQERQRAERLAQYLRDQGIDPETI
jgi:Uma2 family endonuclease